MLHLRLIIPIKTVQADIRRVKHRAEQKARDLAICYIAWPGVHHVMSADVLEDHLLAHLAFNVGGGFSGILMVLVCLEGWIGLR